jgi:hypothetical protein
VVYVAALLVVAGVALYVAAPLFGASGSNAQSKAKPDDLRNDQKEQEIARLARARSLAVQGLSELEFDRHMNKLSEEDYRSLRGPLEAKALSAMAGIERLRDRDRAAEAATRAARAASAKATRPLGGLPPVADTTPSQSVVAPTTVAALAQIARPDAHHTGEAADSSPMPAIQPVARRIRRVVFCPQCGERITADGNFCVECGSALSSAKSMASQAE